jgi:hypothetical protein
MENQEFGQVLELDINAIPVQGFVVSVPNHVGGYRLGKEFEWSHQLNLAYKPNFIHRFFMRTCFGLYWFDK